MLRYTVRPITGWDGPRTDHVNRRSRHTFKASWSSTLDLLERELDHLSASEVVLQADVRDRDIRNDGMLRANAVPASPGVRLLFDSKHGPLTYQCDSCDYWQHNVRSIALGLEALRAVDRYGINAVAGQQYKGYREITAGGGPTTRDQAEQVIRAYAGDHHDAYLPNAWAAARRLTHPDTNGGDRAAWDQVEQAARVLKFGVS
ncbi:molecular chaperone DnaJ [Naumannella sp. ID2617S]|nr:molecular chaperone DnaJ [Naumannella sp. ID2617S]